MKGHSTEKKTQVVVRMTDELRTRLEAMAGNEYRTMSNQIRYILEKAVSDYERKHMEPNQNDNGFTFKKTQDKAS